MIKYFFMLMAMVLIVFACQDGPKVVSPMSSNSTATVSNSTGIFTEDNNNQNTPVFSGSNQEDVHQVEVLEVLPTSKYIYLKVIEKGEEFWIATGKQEAIVGETYFYKGGLLKTNFESKEYNRIFEKVFLVGKIVPVNHSSDQLTSPKNEKEVSEKNSLEKREVKPVEGSLSIFKLVNDIDKYKGKKVQLTGECVKLNANIMGRNWIHLKDGSHDEYDLVVTSNVAIPEGHVITVVGTVNTDVDFGAGYKYDILVEDAEVLN